MNASDSSTSARIVDVGRRLVMAQGYNGFSYADVADAVGVRKASVHHHFPSKADLAVAVIEQSRAAIATQTAALFRNAPNAIKALQGYTDYWERCITDGTAPFCLAAVMAAELPSLPPPVARAVQAHFRDLAVWLTAVLTLGARQGHFVLRSPPDQEAERFMATVYGAMLSARVFGDPNRFSAITRALLQDLRAERPRPKPERPKPVG
ncbi:MAG: TetR/AcrR family transcriptional regulator [Parafilimonas terrae]|nr:TetR/AcrR family transcriptional regulator [Parafilimonas terrae]